MKKKIREKLVIYTVTYALLFMAILMAHAFEFDFSVTINIICEMINTFVWPYLILNSFTLYTDNENIEKHFYRICFIRIVLISVLNFFFIDVIGILESLICFLILNLSYRILFENKYFDYIKKKRDKEREYESTKPALIEEHKDIVNRLKDEEQFDFELDKALDIFGINIEDNPIPKDVLIDYKEFDVLFIIFIFQFICSLFLHVNPLVYVFGVIFIIIGLVFLKSYNFKKYIKKLYKEEPYFDLQTVVGNIEHKLVPNNRKKYFFVLLVVAIVLAIGLNSYPKYVYQKTTDGYEIKYYVKGLKFNNKIVVPNKHDGKNITAIGNGAFSNLLLVKEIDLPNEITSIGKNTFKNCLSLEKITLPSKVNLIDDYAFINNISLKEVELSKELTSINKGAFKNCINLEKINIPSKVSDIKEEAFYNNRNLKIVDISKATELYSLGKEAFTKCDKLDTNELYQTIELNKSKDKHSE